MAGSVSHWVLLINPSLGRHQTVCVRSLSTGAVHPSVVGHSGSLDYRWFSHVTVFAPCICGDYVAGETRTCNITIWNWKTGALVSDQVEFTKYLVILAKYKLMVLIHSLFSKIANMAYSSFDFLDEHHIVYGSTGDTIYAYNFRETRQASQEEVGHLRFQLDLPLIDRDTTSRDIQVRRNALPFHSQESHRDVGSDLTCTPPPFHTDPHARLVVFRIVTFGFGGTLFELHVRAQALPKYVAMTKGARDGRAVVPWSAWCADATATPTRQLPDVRKALMVACGMHAVSHPPDWDQRVLHVYSYTPRRADTVKAAVGTRQGVRVLDVVSIRRNL